MSVVISWATPEEYEDIDVDIVTTRIQRGTNVGGPFVTISDIPATTDGLPKSATNDFVGTFEDTQGILDDFYRIAFIDAAGNVSEFTDPGQGGFISTKHALMDLVRVSLGDTDPLFYQLDAPQFKWRGTFIARFLDLGLSDFNGHPPTPSNFTFDSFPEDAQSILVDWAVARSYRERATKEIANNMTWSDGGANLSITNRPSDYRAMWQAMMSGEMGLPQRTSGYKFAHRPRAIALGIERVPFRIARPLSMIPHFSRVFKFGAAFVFGLSQVAELALR